MLGSGASGGGDDEDDDAGWAIAGVPPTRTTPPARSALQTKLPTRRITVTSVADPLRRSAARSLPDANRYRSSVGRRLGTAGARLVDVR
jgi:hypothetical protein